MEPKTMERLQKIQALAKNIFGKYKGVLTGFEKHDDAGTDVRHNSDGSRALIKPWPGTNGDINDKGQPYLRFDTQDKNWQDGDADGDIVGSHVSICESY